MRKTAPGVKRRLGDAFVFAKRGYRFLAPRRFLQNRYDLLVAELSCFHLIPPVILQVETKAFTGSY